MSGTRLSPKSFRIESNPTLETPGYCQTSPDFRRPRQMGAGHSGGILPPSGAGFALLHLPSACALGCNISPLRGWTEKFACAEVRGKAETSGAEARLLFR